MATSVSILPTQLRMIILSAYFTWHGREDDPWFDYKYTDEELDRWIPRVEAAADKVKKVYGYFNNHFHGYAPENCLYLVEKLGILSNQQRIAKNRLGTKQAGLNDFFQS